MAKNKKPKLSKRERERRKEKSLRRFMCTQNEHEDVEHTHAPSQCIHYDCFRCSRCGNCYACDHTAIEATPERERTVRARFWWHCQDGFEKPAFMDVGQFAGLKKVTPGTEIDWSQYQ